MFNPLSWAVPRLRDVAISGLYWELVTLIDISFWLIDTTRQFMLRDAHAIALDAFAQANFFSPMILSVHRWLAAALPLVVAPFFAELEAAPVSPVITATDKTPRK
jgi:hypothetical protein